MTNNLKYAIGGIIGTLLMFSGDMLFYFTMEPIGEFTEDILPLMGTIPSWRLTLGAFLGPVAGFLYSVGYYHVYLNIKESVSKWSKVFFSCLVLSIFFGSVFHAYFAPLGFSAQYPDLPLSDQIMVPATWIYGAFLILFLISFIPLGILMLLNKTPYPRWYIIFNPVLMYIVFHVFDYLPQPLKIILAGGKSNLVMLIFFVSSYLFIRRLNKSLKTAGESID